MRTRFTKRIIANATQFPAHGRGGDRASLDEQIKSKDFFLFSPILVALFLKRVSILEKMKLCGENNFFKLSNRGQNRFVRLLYGVPATPPRPDHTVIAVSLAPPSTHCHPTNRHRRHMFVFFDHLSVANGSRVVCWSRTRLVTRRRPFPRLMLRLLAPRVAFSMVNAAYGRIVNGDRILQYRRTGRDFYIFFFGWGVVRRWSLALFYAAAADSVQH
ncbi:hypothetical protein QTP88_012842 [Uroleucon formosanum]